MKLFLAFVSTFTITVMADSGQGGYSGGGGGGGAPFSAGGGGFNFGNGGYTTGGGFGSGAGQGSGFAAPGGAGGFSGGVGGDAGQGPQVHKYVSIHTAPEDPDDFATKTVRVPGGNTKRVNLIFIKAPSNGADQKTEVVLPEPEEQKNLVYVLVQKSDPTANLKIKRPEPTKPSKPEVYFIRYKDGRNGQNEDGGASGGHSDAGVGGSPSPAYGVPTPVFRSSPSPAYGAP